MQVYEKFDTKVSNEMQSVKSSTQQNEKKGKYSSPKRILYISWAESCSRSEHTARELGGTSYMVYLPFFGSHPLSILPKYLGQFFMSLWLLVRHRPDALFVMSPPLFASFPALLWKWLFGVPFVLDCHTGAFTNRRWRRLQWLQYFLCRQAATNLVTNDHLKELIELHGSKTTIVRDVPVEFETTDEYLLPTGFNIAVVCSFNYDEPISEMFTAASQLVDGDTNFFFTGNPKYLRPEVADQRPDNVVLTGFLSDQQYGSLLCQADVVMTLTTQDHTMLRGAWEAIYQKTPVIISDWPILREAFDIGAIHVDNSQESIVQAVLFAQKNISDLCRQAEKAREQRLERWKNVKKSLLKAFA